MPYNRFTLRKAQETFQLQIDETKDLFSTVVGVKTSDLLDLTLARNVSLALAINTEKSRSEMIIAPIFARISRFGTAPGKSIFWASIQCGQGKRVDRSV